MRIALLTCSNLVDYIAYEELLEVALKKQRIDYQWIEWDKYQEVTWQKFDAAVIRTTWDYQSRSKEFIEALGHIDHKCKLWNPLNIVKWNSSKEYLLEFKRTKTQPVPTTEINVRHHDDLKKIFKEFDTSTIIIKPFISASSHDTYKINISDIENHTREIIELNQRKKLLAQPFLNSILEEGEFSFHFFNGKFSHGILKTPKKGDFRSQEEYGSSIKSVIPTKEELSFAENVLLQIKEDLLYARVDFVRRDGKEFYLMELELIEPSLYFSYDKVSADRFVQAIKEKNL